MEAEQEIRGERRFQFSEFESFRDESCPQQRIGSKACGVYALKFCTHIASRVPVHFQEDIELVRMQILAELLTGQYNIPKAMREPCLKKFEDL